MTARDFADGINLKDAANATYNEQQQQSVEPALPEVPVLDGPIKPSEPGRVLLPGYEHFDRMVKNREQKGIVTVILFGPAGTCIPLRQAFQPLADLDGDECDHQSQTSGYRQSNAEIGCLGKPTYNRRPHQKTKETDA
jgi:hypothetical protein